MKIALLLRGIAFNNNYVSFRGGRRLIDYKINFSSIKNHLIEDNDVDIYFHTWKTDGLDEVDLVETLKPKAYQIDLPIKLDNQKQTQYYSCNQSITRVLKLFLENSNDIEYDHIIITRFDLIFYKNFSSFSLKPKIVYTMSKNSQTSEDNFLVLNREIIPKFLEILWNYRFFSHHKAIEKLNNMPIESIFGNEPIKYNNPFYSLGWQLV